MKKYKVSVVQRILPHYRVGFFEQLHEQLAGKDIELQVIHGQHAPGTVPKSVLLDRPWARFSSNNYLNVLGRELVWQSAFERGRTGDLVVVEHAARLLGNYPLLVRHWLGNFRLAFWGHGANFQAKNPDSRIERFKRTLFNRIDWWFAYTQSSEAAVRRAGFPVERITIVQNAIDDSVFRNALHEINPAQLSLLRKELGMQSGRVGLYCGGLYREKRLHFLLEACLHIRESVPDFEVIFIGSGPDQTLVEAAADRYSWIHYVGPVFGAERARYFAVSQALLMPGPVGLVIVDSFVSGVPLFTTDIPAHGPEIAYLCHGVNGIMSPFSVEDYARSVAEFLMSSEKLEMLRQGCLHSATVYTLDNMVQNFVDGIEACLAADRR